MFREMVKILTLGKDKDVISTAEKLIIWILRYDLKVKETEVRIYGLWHGVLCHINSFFGEELNEKWAGEILREIYFLVCVVDQSKSARFTRIV